MEGNNNEIVCNLKSDVTKLKYKDNMNEFILDSEQQLKTRSKNEPMHVDQLKPENRGRTGIIPRFLKSLFDEIGKLEIQEGAHFTFEYSFFEIYKEKIYDLLQQTYDYIDDGNGRFRRMLKALNLREKKNNQIVIGRNDEHVRSNCNTPENLFSKRSEELAEVLEDLKRANARKHINQTVMNQRSSRSHTIMTFDVKLVTKIVISGKSEEGKLDLNSEKYKILKKSQSVFIDLAGSERQVYNKDELLEEGCFINKSLSILNHVITTLSNSKAKDFVHYRDSK